MSIEFNFNRNNVLSWHLPISMNHSLLRTTNYMYNNERNLLSKHLMLRYCCVFLLAFLWFPSISWRINHCGDHSSCCFAYSVATDLGLIMHWKWFRSGVCVHECVYTCAHYANFHTHKCKMRTTETASSSTHGHHSELTAIVMHEVPKSFEIIFISFSFTIMSNASFPFFSTIDWRHSNWRKNSIIIILTTATTTK